MGKTTHYLKKYFHFTSLEMYVYVELGQGVINIHDCAIQKSECLVHNSFCVSDFHLSFVFCM